MKIFQINSVCGIKSTGRICTDLAETLRMQGHECMIGYGRGFVPKNKIDISYRIGSIMNPVINMIRARIFDNAGFGSKQATEKLIDKIKEYAPDIIHLHNIHGYYVNIEILFDYLAIADIPIVWTLHDCWSFTGHCTYFSLVDCKRWMTGCYCCPQKKEYPKALFWDCSARNWKKKEALFTSVKNMTIVTPSEWLADQVRQSYLKKYNVEVISNGIDIGIFRPIYGKFRKTYNLEHKKIILGVASVWSKRKGFDDFIKLSQLLNEEYVIVLVGVNSKQKKNLPTNIIGISSTNNTRELAEIYTDANVFVNPTYEDNYPTVNLEAQACGTPVITYETGGSIESVPETNVVPVGDISAVWELITSERYTIQENCVADFDKKRFSESYSKLYFNIKGDSLYHEK